MKKGLLLGLAICLFGVTAASASEKPYYYFQGQKQELEHTNKIAVRLIDGTDIKLVITGQLHYGFSEKRIEELNLWLIEFNRPVNIENIAKRFSSHPAVQIATPVYSKGVEMLVITDELMVKEKNPHRSIVDLKNYVYAHSLIFARLGVLNNTWVLKTTKQSHLNALEAANLLVEDGLAEYAQPNFLRMMPK